MISTLLRRSALALVAAGAVLVGATSAASAHQTVVVTRVYRPAPIIVYRAYAPPVVVYRAPIVRRHIYVRY